MSRKYGVAAKRVPPAAFGLVTALVLLWTPLVATPASANGRTDWVSRYNGPGNGDDGASFVAVSPDGARIYVTGTSMGTTHNDYATVAYDTATGTGSGSAGTTAPETGRTRSARWA